MEDPRANLGAGICFPYPLFPPLIPAVLKQALAMKHLCIYSGADI